jgi:hypothetical protein
MRRLAAAVLALPVLAFVYLSTFVRRSVLAQAVMLAMAISLVVGGLLVGLPAKGLSGEERGPLNPVALKNAVTGDLPLDEPFKIQFSKPMDQGSVAQGLTIEPNIAAGLSWDPTGQVLSITPEPHWTAYTYYRVTIADWVLDQDGLTLGDPETAVFVTGALTNGTIDATVRVGDEVAPTTSFQITFNRPVKLATVNARFAIDPTVPGLITGDDPKDEASQVFTYTPTKPLATSKKYIVRFMGTLATDSAGIDILPVEPLVVKTVAAPIVVRFRPKDRTVTYDPGQLLSVRFTMPMDRATTEAAFSATVKGKLITGKMYWAENDTVLCLLPAKKLSVGAKVTLKVSLLARSADGIPIKAAKTGVFTVAKPTSYRVATGGGPIANSPWGASERYYMRLMNCTRTGGWVTRSGECSSASRHTLPAQLPLKLDSGISSRVSRPYAKFMADHSFLLHRDPYYGSTPQSRMVAGGYTNYAWGENIASPSTSGNAGMIDVEIFFQNEYPCRCEHYANIMHPMFDRAGVGVWVGQKTGKVRVVINFYHP